MTTAERASGSRHEPADDGPLVAAADGSALGNPGPAGWAWYVNETCWRAGGWPHGTNNMGELKAVLDLVESTAGMPERPLKILCDSQYVIKCITQWMPGWKAKGWKKKDGKPVLNRDLLEQLDAALSGRTYEFEWVKGHAGHELNEHADDKAHAAATAYQKHQTPDEGPGLGGLAPNEVSREVSPGATRSTAAGEAATRDASTLTGVQPSRAQESPAEAALRCEQELNDPATHHDASRVQDLLAEELVWITVRGRHAGREAALRYLDQAFGLRGEPEYVSTHSPSEHAGLVVSRVKTPRGPAVRTSLWVRRETGRWGLAVRQDTPEA